MEQEHLDKLAHSNFVEQGFALIELLVVTTALALIVGVLTIVITDVSRRV